MIESTSKTDFKTLNFSPDILSALKTEVFNNNFYLERGAIIVPCNPSEPLYGVARFNNRSSGHFSFMPGYVHGSDSLAAVEQFGYTFFMQAGVEGVFPQIPKMSIERLIEIVKDKSGGAHMKRVGEVEYYRALPHDFNGRMKVENIHGGNGHGYVFTTKVKFGQVQEDSLDVVCPCSHVYEGVDFRVKF